MYITKLSYQPKLINQIWLQDTYEKIIHSNSKMEIARAPRVVSHCKTKVPCSEIWPQPGITNLVGKSDAVPAWQWETWVQVKKSTYEYHYKY